MEKAIVDIVIIVLIIATSLFSWSMDLSVIGGNADIATGLRGSSMLSMLAGWPTVVSVPSILLSFGFSGLIGIFFGYYPAYKASLLDPIDALRYE